jgi:hypothetical protein
VTASNFLKVPIGRHQEFLVKISHPTISTTQTLPVKKKPGILIFHLLSLILIHQMTYGQIGINSDGVNPHPSSMLDVSSTVKGMLPPRMTAAQMLAIPAPAIGLTVYNLTSQGTFPDNYMPGYYYFNGNRWVPIANSDGLLNLPVLSQSQIDTVAATTGSIVFNSTTQCINYHTGLNWMSLCGTCTPQPTVSNAGTDQNVIGNNTILSANTPLAGTGLWQIISGSNGVIAEPSNPLSNFSGEQPGTYTLRWTISNSCGSSQDDVIITFHPVPPSPSDELLFVPYVDCTLWPNFEIENTNETGIYNYTCAFIVDNQFSTGANPCWGGYSTLLLDYYQDHISALRSQGGDVIISFGGANGIELAYAATDEFEARDAYKAVIDAYNLASIDFDIEGFLAAHQASILRRSKAMRLLQNEYPNLRISLTLPVMPTGLTNDGLNVVENAIDQNVDINCVNVMAMDYGPSGIDMGDAAISAGEAVFQQLKTLYINNGINLPDSVIWRKIGITPMIGQNDVQGEVFYLEDANDLAQWASQRKIGRLAMWSANRDHQCANASDPLYSCSHITQTPYQFSSILGSVANGSVSMSSRSSGYKILPTPLLPND